MKTTRSTKFLIALGAVGVGYLAVNEYRRYKLEQLKARAASDPSCATCVRQVFETIGTQSPTTGADVITVSQTAGLPSCDSMFPVKPDGIEVLRQMLIAGARGIGKCA